MASKLLDFRPNPELVPAGLNLIRNLQGQITMITFVGDSRCGKSELAQRLGQALGLPAGSFPSAPTQAPVTVGVDIAVVPFNGGSLVIADCEGGNNAQAAVRQMVHVLGTIFASQLVFVCGAQAGESQLQTLGHAVAARQIIHGAAEGGLAAPDLVFTVNMKNPILEEQNLDELLREQHDPPRNALRATIKAGYPSRRLFSVPFLQQPDFEVKWQALRAALLAGARPLNIAGVPVAGPQLAQALQTGFNQIMQQQVMHFPDVLRVVLFEGHLRPLAERLAGEFSAGLPNLMDNNFVANLERLNNQQVKLEQFKKAAAHIQHDGFKAEALRVLEQQMSRTWEQLVNRNIAIGQQVRETTLESKEDLKSSQSQSRIYYAKGRDWCHCRGTRVRYCSSGGQHILNSYVTVSRPRTVHKDGSVTYAEWIQTSSRQVWS